MSSEVKIGVLASGQGSNFEAICRHWSECALAKTYPLAIMVCNRSEAKAFHVAKTHGIPAELVAHKGREKASFEAELLEVLGKERVGLLVLAGFDRLLSESFLSAFRGPVINLHPSILPAHPGLGAIKRTFDDGGDMGVSIHYVDAGMDTGTLIAQMKVSVSAKDDLASAEARVHEAEHALYPLVIEEVAKVLSNGR